MKTNNMHQTTFKFHFGRGDSLTLWASDMKSAVKRFREMMGNTVFMTDQEMQRRVRERNGNIMVEHEAEVADRKEKLKAMAEETNKDENDQVSIPASFTEPLAA